MGQNQSHRVDDDRDPEHPHAPLHDASQHPSSPPSPSLPPPPPPPAAIQHARVPSDLLSSPFAFPSLPQSIFVSFGPGSPLPSPLLSQPPSASATVDSFPRLTLAQMAQLRDAGVDLDLAFVPYQMPRLTSHAVTEGEGQEREKECLRITNPFAIKTAKLIPHSPPSSSSSPSSPSALPPALPLPLSGRLPLSRLSLSVTFDLTVACRLSICPCATEVIDRTQPDQLPSFTPHPDCTALHSTHPAGMGQTLSLPLLSLYSAEVLAQAQSGVASRGGAHPSLLSFSSSRHYYPLILHFERLPPDAVQGCEGGGKGREEEKEGGGDGQPSVDHLIAYFIFSDPRQKPAAAVAPPPLPPPPSTTSVPPSAVAASTPSSTAPPPFSSSSSASASAAPLPPISASSSVSMTLKRLKQKVKVGSRSFEVADVYGLPPPAGSPAEPAPSSTESAECVICLTARRTHAIFPCRHLCLCSECAGLLREQTNRCPICRRAVEAVIPILVNSVVVEEERERRVGVEGSVGGDARGDVRVEVRGE